MGRIAVPTGRGRPELWETARRGVARRGAPAGVMVKHREISLFRGSSQQQGTLESATRASRAEAPCESQL